MNKPLKRVAIAFSRKKKICEDTIVNLIAVLKSCDCRIFAADVLHDYFPAGGKAFVSFLPIEDMYRQADVAIALGGDGSILSAAHYASRFNVPILGVNFGKIGYMTELNANEFQLIPTIVQGNYRLDSRMMLDAELLDANDNVRMKRSFLNDCALTNGPVARLLNFNIYLNGKQLNAVRSDGLVVSTPTGSTAYSMSAGGPILDPGVAGIVLTPICPYSLSSRPLVIRDDSVIEIRDITCRENQVYLTTDGKRSLEVSRGDRIRITRSAYQTHLIKTSDDGFVEVLYRKLSDHDEK